jgi:hypothetical protein
MRGALHRLFSKYSSAKMNALLDRALIEEQSYKAELDFHHSFLQTTNFELKQTSTSPQIKLLKSQDDFDLEVTFKAKLPTIEEEAYGEGRLTSYNEFQVLLMRRSSPLQLLVDCSIANSKCIVNGMLVAQDFSRFSPDQLYMQAEIYKGKAFRSLRDVSARQTLQTHFIELLAELGVDDHLAAFINAYSVDRESVLKVDWIKEVRDTLVPKS